MSRHAFTLIELLVVIAIIALLASILFPVLSSAKHSSYQSACNTNLTNLHRAFTLYATDWSGRLPLPAVVQVQSMAWISSQDAGNSKQIGALWPYIKTIAKSGDKSNIWSCPLALPVPAQTINAGYGPGCGYAMNCYIRAAHSGEANNAFDPNIPNFYLGMPSDAPRTPSRLILLYEGVQDRFAYCDRQGCPFYVKTEVVHPRFKRLGAAYIAQDYHNGRSSFLFLDGHVKMMRPAETWSR